MDENISPESVHIRDLSDSQPEEYIGTIGGMFSSKYEDPNTI
jgi:hypothetical protein